MSPMRDGRTNERTREDSATQPMDAGWLSFAKNEQLHFVMFGNRFFLGIQILIQQFGHPLFQKKKPS